MPNKIKSNHIKVHKKRERKKKSSKLTDELFFTLCQLQLSISQKESVWFVPCFVGVCHECPISSGVTARGRRGAECSPETSEQEIFVVLPGKKRQEKNVKWRRKKKKERKIEREGGKLMGESYKFGEEFFFFFFLLFTFQNHWNLFWVYQNGKFSPGKTFHARGKKKTGNMTLPPLKNIPLMPLPIRVNW